MIDISQEMSKTNKIEIFFSNTIEVSLILIQPSNQEQIHLRDSMNDQSSLHLQAAQTDGKSEKASIQLPLQLLNVLYLRILDIQIQFQNSKTYTYTSFITRRTL
ncbi:unnamed protein product [Paramecium octaurelia]|uniref:Uncharacterized protein n=1 Tax=Paramecium octaurelia TaxID=43137 RepID=A0A8S1VS28_PAROT|nr:unnamed protein product [Paramecium octaurelia]